MSHAFETGGEVLSLSGRPAGSRSGDGDGPSFGNLRILLYWMGGFLLVAFFALTVFYSTDCHTSAAMTLWALGLSAVGAIVGFLFGIPRVLSQSDANAAASLPPTQAAALATEVRKYQLGANTNLEQVSDWLTKIMVGVGLVELSEIPKQVNRLADIMTPSFGDTPESSSVAIATILLFSAGGFLIGYITTRAFLPAILRDAEQQAAERLRALSRVGAQASQAPAQPPAAAPPANPAVHERLPAAE